jgi:hypothetical protein
VKNKLRKIVVNEQEFLWYIKGAVQGRNGTLQLKIFLSGETKHPVQIAFTTWDNPVIGFPLNFGYALYNRTTSETETVNLNQPAYIRKIILYALEQGWNGKNKVSLPDGLSILNALGYDIEVLLPGLT